MNKAEPLDDFEETWTRAVAAWNRRATPLVPEREIEAAADAIAGYTTSVDAPRTARAALVAARRAHQPVEPTNSAMGITYRHKKRGTEYELIGFGRMQAENWVTHPGRGVGLPADGVDMREVAIYRSITDPTEIWVRPREEFEDGRFEEIKNG